MHYTFIAMQRNHAKHIKQAFQGRQRNFDAKLPKLTE